MRNLEGKTLLIVDDETELLELVSARFVASGARVLTASNGHQASEILACETVDLIISDMQMPGPGGGGLELLARVRANDPVLPLFVLMSGNLNVNPELPPGIAAIVAKPFSFRKLDATIEALLLGNASRAAESLTV